MYNVEKYIGECLDSLLAQTFQNFEVIVVDDCSTDSSCAIVRSYAEKFGERLILAHTEKNSGGCAVPRNVGLPFSRGKYIFFADADDLLTKTGLEELYTLAEKFKADVVYFDGYYNASNDLKEITPSKPPTVTEPTPEPDTLPERIQAMAQGKYEMPTWTKFVERRLLIENRLYFPNCRPSEDDIWTFGLLFYAKRILRTSVSAYIRRFSDGSITRREKTPVQIVTFWASPILKGLEILDGFMTRHEFFKSNPQYRYAVLEMFVNWRFNSFLGASFYVQPAAVYEAIRQEYGEYFGEHGILVAMLSAVLNTQQRISLTNQKKFQQFAEQAQARIAELEAEIKRLQNN